MFWGPGGPQNSAVWGPHPAPPAPGRPATGPWPGGPAVVRGSLPAARSGARAPVGLGPGPGCGSLGPPGPVGAAARPVGSLGLSAGRPPRAAGPGCSPGGPRCGVAGSGRGRPGLAPGSAPGSGGRRPRPAPVCGLPRGGSVALAGLRACPAPLPAPPRVPLPPGPAGRPGYRHGPPRRAPAGGGWGGGRGPPL